MNLAPLIRKTFETMEYAPFRRIYTKLVWRCKTRNLRLLALKTCQYYPEYTATLKDARRTASRDAKLLKFTRERAREYIEQAELRAYLSVCTSILEAVELLTCRGVDHASLPLIKRKYLEELADVRSQVTKEEE